MAAKVQLFGDFERESFIHDNRLRVTAVSDPAGMLVRAIVSESGKLLAILLQAGGATGTLAAGIDHAADGGEIADLEGRNLGAHVG